MKTPRDILLARHRAAESKLNAVRRAALATGKKAPPESSPISWRDFLHSFRWHLAGISAIWLLIIILHLDTNRAPAMMASVPPAKIPSPQVIMASLRENRRQLFEMIETQPSDIENRGHFLPKPRSERRSELVIA